MTHDPDMSDVIGAALVDQVVSAVAAGQNLLLVGPPGVGKTMIARRVPGILPELSERKRGVLEGLYRAHGMMDALSRFDGPSPWPFRAPHHSCSRAALSGGARPYTGELALARFGVLLLDELVEFRVDAIDELARRIRADPRTVMVIATANPCPCGWSGVAANQRGSWKCSCSRAAIERYQKNVGRFALELGLATRIEVPSLRLAKLRGAPRGRSTEEIREQLYGAR